MPIQFVPIEAGMRSLQAGPEPGDPMHTSEGPEANRYPATLLDLPYTGTLSSLLEARLAAQLGIPVAGIELSAGRSVFVQQFQRYAWVNEGSKRLMYGVAVRWLVEIQKVETQAKLTSLAMLAASAQLGYVNATVRFDVIGMISREIDAAIPAPTVLSVETHADYAAALKKITGLMWEEKSVKILPQPLSVGIDRLGDVSSDVMEAWVHYKISRGFSLRQTLEDLVNPTDSVRRGVEGWYRDIITPVSEDTAPTADQRQLSESRFSHFRFENKG